MGTVYLYISLVLQYPVYLYISLVLQYPVYLYISLVLPYHVYLYISTIQHALDKSFSLCIKEASLYIGYLAVKLKTLTTKNMYFTRWFSKNNYP